MSQSNKNHKDDLEKYLADAYEVEHMSRSAGWSILERDAKTNLSNLSKVWLTLDPNSKEYNECRILGLASLQLLETVNNYAAQRKKAEELWLRLTFPEDSIALDMDTHSPLNEEEHA